MTRKGLLTIFGAISLASLLVHCGQENTAFTSQDAAGFAGKVAGRVVDRSGNAVSAALVTASPGGVTTASAADGSYELSGLAAGKYRLSYSKADYRDTIRPDSLTLGMMQDTALGAALLRYRYATVKGTAPSVTNPGTKISVMVEDQGSSNTTISGGSFKLTRVEPGTVHLFAVADGVGYGIKEVQLTADTTVDIGTMQIDHKGGTVSGTVTDTAGHAIAYATVTAAGGGLKTTSDALGSYTLKNVPTTTTVVVDAGSLGKTSVTGISVLEGGSTSLPAVSVAPVTTTATSASLPSLLPSFALGATTDKELLLQVQDSLGIDSTWQVLRYLWSLDGGATWADSTASGTWHLQPSQLPGWSQGTTGKYQVVVRARVYKATGTKVLDTLTGAARITVQLMAPPDRTPPTITRVSPSSNTTMAWKDSVVTVAWKVSDDRKLGTVLVDGDTVAFAGGLVSRQYTLGVGRTMVRLLARDSAGNVAQDSLLLVRSVAVVVPHDSTLSSLSVVSKSGAKLMGFSPKVQSYTDTVASTDSSVTVTVVASDSLSKVTINGTTSGTVRLSDTGNLTPIRIVVKAVDGDSLVYTVTVVRKAAAVAHDSSLTSLTLSGASLKGFVPGTLNYQDTVSSTTDTMTVTATAGDALDTVWINGTQGTSRQVNLGSSGTTTNIRIKVKAMDGDTLVYMVAVVRKPAAVAHDSTLSSLSVVSKSGAKLVGFSPKVQSYVDSVASTDSSVTVSAVASDTLSTVYINGAKGTTRMVGLPDTGASVRIVVKAVDGDSLAYTISLVRRTTLTPTSDISTLSPTFPAMSVTSDMADTLAESVYGLTGVAGYHASTDASTYTTYLTTDSAVGISYNIAMAASTPAYSAIVGLDVPLTKDWQVKDLSKATSITFYAKSSAANVIHLIVESDAYDSTTAAANGHPALTSSNIKITTAWKQYTIDVTDLTMSSWYRACMNDCLTTGWYDPSTYTINIGMAVKALDFQPVLDGGWLNAGANLDAAKATGDFYIKDIKFVK